MPPVTSANFGKLLDPGIREVFDDRLRQTPVMFDKIFNIQGSSRASEQDLTVVGLDDWRQRGSETEAAEFTEPLQGYTKTYVHDEYSSALEVSRKMIDDDQYGVILKQAGKLAMTAMRRADKKAATVFTSGFNTNNFTGADGVALFSASHARLDGGGNLSNTATGALNEANLETAIIDMAEELDDRGQLIEIEPDTILVPPALEKEALILMKSTGRVGTADNDVNVYNGRLKVMVWKRIGAAAGGSDTAWFLLDTNQHQLNFFWRVRPEIAREENIETHVTKWVGYMRFSVGFTDWRGAYGSTGTA